MILNLEILLRLEICSCKMVSDKRERERERDLRPGCGHMAAASEATCRSVYKVAIIRPVMAIYLWYNR